MTTLGFGEDMECLMPRTVDENAFRMLRREDLPLSFRSSWLSSAMTRSFASCRWLMTAVWAANFMDI